MPVGSIVKRTNTVLRAGTLHLGVKNTSKGGKLYPKETDYFVLGPTPTEPDVAKAHKHFIDQYGREPKSIDIVFTSDDEDVIAKTYLQMYKCENPNEQDPTKRRNYLACIGKGLDPVTDQPTMAFWSDLNHKPQSGIIPLSDNVVAKIHQDLDMYKQMLNGQLPLISSRAAIEKEINGLQGVLRGRNVPRLCCHHDCPNFINKECKVVMTMSFLVPLGNAFAEYILRTSSTKSIHNVLNCIASVKKVVETYCKDMPDVTIAKFPLKLYRVRDQTKYIDASGKQAFSEHYPLVLELSPDFKERFQNKLSSQLKNMMLGSVAPTMLPAAEAPGAATIDMTMPDDLYPTAEERETADQVRRDEEMAKISQQQLVLQERASWAADPEINALMDKWAAQKGKPFPMAKKIAWVQTFESKTALLEKLKASIVPEQSETAPCDNPEVVCPPPENNPEVVETPMAADADMPPLA